MPGFKLWGSSKNAKSGTASARSTTAGSSPDFFSPVSPSVAPRSATASPTKKGVSSRYSVSSPSSPRPHPKGAWEPKDRDDSRRSRLKKPGVPPASASARVERCTRCTKEEMWTAYDVFRNMDKRRRNRIGRIDFHKSLKDYPTLEKLKMLKRSQLEVRFRENAQDVSLEEFLQLIWPAATEADIVKMLRWGQLREAQSVLRDDSFRGETSELRRVFDLLDEDGDTMLSVSELERAQIFTQKEIATLMFTDRPEASRDTQLSFADFCFYAQHHLKALYVTPDMQKAMKEEQEQNQAQELERSFRNMFAR